MSGQDSNSLPFSELTILCNPLLIKPFIFVGEGVESNHTSERYPVSPMHHLTIDLPELTHPASPVGAPKIREDSRNNYVTNRNLVAL
ncbi:hypothetical protein [Salmonella phage SPHG3]|uniref:Uncharacterized protein n=1 Tax=Salmonella phage SPHG3 TaxID=2801526 RepID=A0A7T7Z885_9CAUD|nr:hypothetical protein [Salmonella phage SPHG3]